MAFIIDRPTFARRLASAASVDEGGDLNTVDNNATSNKTGWKRNAKHSQPALDIQDTSKRGFSRFRANRAPGDKRVLNRIQAASRCNVPTKSVRIRLITVMAVRVPAAN